MEEWTIPEIQTKMGTGELTARRLAELFLERIDAIDRKRGRVAPIGCNALSLRVERLSGFRGQRAEIRLARNVLLPVLVEGRDAVILTQRGHEI